VVNKRIYINGMAWSCVSKDYVVTSDVVMIIVNIVY